MTLPSLRLLPLAVLCAIALAACAAPAPATPEPPDEPPAVTPAPVPDTPEPAPPEPVTPEPVTPEPAPPGNGDAVLRDAFPTSIAGQPLQVQMFTLQQLLDEVGQDVDDVVPLEAFLADLNVPASAVSMAIAFGVVDDEFINISAVRSPGISGPALLAAMTAATERELADIEDVSPVVRQATVGGRQVTIVELDDAVEEDERAYIYAVGDIVFQVETTPEVAEVVLAELP
jgi:hypothetical protein